MGATMAINFSKLSYLQNITPNDIPETYQQWLYDLNAPTIVDFTCNNTDKWRVVTTLLHGNEPSGFIALHRWIKEECFKDLVVNIRFIIVSIEAAQFEPAFTTRYLSGGKDMNRCFGVKSLSDYYLRAELISSCIRQVKPEAIIDLHNTSGANPAFSVSCSASHQHLSMTSLFCDRVIVSHLKLGALLEQDFACPIITIECGGANDENSHLTAFSGIQRFCHLTDVLCTESEHTIEVIYQPIRFLIKKGTTLSYSDDLPSVGITLREDIESLNFGISYKGTHIGKTDQLGLANFCIEDEHLHGKPEDYFNIEGNNIITKSDLRVFMATKIPAIAVHDCLFYMVKEKSL